LIFRPPLVSVRILKLPCVAFVTCGLSCARVKTSFLIVASRSLVFLRVLVSIPTQLRTVPRKQGVRVSSPFYFPSLVSLSFYEAVLIRLVSVLVAEALLALVCFCLLAPATYDLIILEPTARGF
jgi:hypothetical protein